MFFEPVMLKFPRRVGGVKRVWADGYLMGLTVILVCCLAKASSVSAFGDLSNCAAILPFE